MGGALMRRGEAMEVLGVGRKKFEAMLECGVLQAIHLVRDGKGYARDRALFRRAQVMGLTLEGKSCALKGS